MIFTADNIFQSNFLSESFVEIDLSAAFRGDPLNIVHTFQVIIHDTDLHFKAEAKKWLLSINFSTFSLSFPAMTS